MTEIRAAFANPGIKVEEVKGKIDALQQLLFEIGTYVYERGDGSQAETVQSTVGSETIKVEEDFASSQESEDDFSFDDAETVTADYEAIE